MYSTSISRITGVQYNLKFLVGSSTVAVLVFEIDTYGLSSRVILTRPSILLKKLYYTVNKLSLNASGR